MNEPEPTPLPITEVLELPDNIVKCDDYGRVLEQRFFEARQPNEHGWAIAHVSATQLGQYEDCPRKWFFRYILGHKYPETEPQKNGKRVHTDLEVHLLGWTPHPYLPEPKHLFDAGMVPPVSHVIDVEFDVQSLEFKLCDPEHGPDLKGYIDLTWRENPEDPPEHMRLRIWDWKLRSAFKWAPTTEELQTDYQANIYSYAIFELLDRNGIHREELRFSHMNLLRVDKGGPDFKLVEATMHRDKVQGFVKTKLEPIVWQMNETAQKNLRMIRPHKSMCFKYGGCEHKNNCYKIPYELAEPRPVTAASLLKLTELLPNGGTDMTTLNDLTGLNLNQQPQQQANGQTQPMFQQPALPQQQQTPPQPHYPAPNQVVQGYVTQPAQQPQQTQVQVQPMRFPNPAYNVQPPSTPPPPVQPAQQQFVQPAPNIQPPDSQPDIQPRDANDMTVQEFPWTNVDGIGDKGVEKMMVFFAEKGITHMSQIIQGFDFQELPGVGAKGAQGIRLEITKHSIFNPNAGGLGLDALQATPPPDPAQAATPANWPPPVPAPQPQLPGPGQADSIPLMQQMGVDLNDQQALLQRAGEVTLSGGIAEIGLLTQDNKIRFLEWRKAQGNPDYAPPQAPVQQAPVQQAALTPPQTHNPVAEIGAALGVLEAPVQAPEPQATQTQIPEESRQRAVATAVPVQVDVLSKVREVTVERYVSRSDYNNAAVRFTIQIDEGDDAEAIARAGLEYAERIALGED